jgi:hypothetical protein
MISVEMYKILNPKTGLFSKGGIDAKTDCSFYWSKNGKVWNTSGSIRSHLSQFVSNHWIREESRYSDYQINIPEHWVVIKVYTEDGVLKQDEINAIEFYKQSKTTIYAKSLKGK